MRDLVFANNIIGIKNVLSYLGPNVLDEYHKTALQYALECTISEDEGFRGKDFLDIACVLLEARGNLGDGEVTQEQQDLLHRSLRYIINAGNKKAFRLLSKVEGIDINFKGADGKTVLMYALDKGHNDFSISLLNQEEVDVNIKDNSDCTAFDLCSFTHSRSVEVLTLFLKRKAETTIRKSDNNEHRIEDDIINAALTNLAHQNERAAIYHAVDLGYVNKDVLGQIVRCDEDRGQNLLLDAAKENNKLLTMTLLEMDVINANAADSERKTAFDLFEFKSKEDADLLALLLLKQVETRRRFNNSAFRIPAEIMASALAILAGYGKSDNNITPEQSGEAIDYAIGLGYTVDKATVFEAKSTGAAKKLLEKNPSLDGLSLLKEAVQENNASAASALAGVEGIAVNTKDENSRKTLLMQATDLGYDEVVEALAKNKEVELNSRDSENGDFGDTALILAAKKATATREVSHVSMLTHLLSRDGIDTSIIGREGLTAFSLFQFSMMPRFIRQ